MTMTKEDFVRRVQGDLQRRALDKLESERDREREARGLRDPSRVAISRYYRRVEMARKRNGF